MRRFALVTSIMAAGLLVSISTTLAGTPPLINYQGRLTDSTNAPLDTTVNMTFKIYSNAAGTSVVWSEMQSGVVVSDGLFSVYLGSVTPLPDSVYADTARYLGITVGGGSELTPLTRLASVPYAYRVSTVDGTTGGAISGVVKISERVSIGAGNPYQKLVVYENDSREGSGAGMLISQLGSGDATLTFETVGGLFTNQWGVGIDHSDAEKFKISYFTPFGNFLHNDRIVADSVSVGIGTSNPAYDLEVHGVVMLEDTSAAPTPSTGHSGMYSSSGELFAIDQAGNTTQLSPHDPETGEWIFYSKNVKTGRVVRIDMEKLVRTVEQFTGEKFMTEEWEK